MDRPPILDPYLKAHPESAAIDPVALLARVITHATDELTEQSIVAEMLKSGKVREESLARIRFANRCVGAVRNELQLVNDALGTLLKIIRHLEADIRAAVANDENLSQLKVAASG